MEILDPTTDAAARTLTYAPRPASLQGKRVGLIDNTKFNSDVLLRKIGEVLKAKYGAAEARIWRKHGASVPAHDAIIAEIRQTCDVMVAGVGD